jgi:hypothetical protein
MTFTKNASVYLLIFILFLSLFIPIERGIAFSPLEKNHLSDSIDITNSDYSNNGILIENTDETTSLEQYLDSNFYEISWKKVIESVSVSEDSITIATSLENTSQNTNTIKQIKNAIIVWVHSRPLHSMSLYILDQDNNVLLDEPL